jgi:hypothetical protein
MKYDKSDELDWLAFCYIAGEMSRDETAAFEQRLADEQEAREAVARAVELTRAIAAAKAARPTVPASVSAVPRRRYRAVRRWFWAAVATAASLAGVVLYQHAYRPADSPREMAAESNGMILNAQSQRLARAWSQTREELAALELDPWGTGAPEEEDPLDEFDPSLVEDPAAEEPLTENLPPSWMLAAVRTGAGGSDATTLDGRNFQEN